MAITMNPATIGVILAGGLSRRFGCRDKFLFRYKEKPLIQHVIDGARGQVEDLIISANGDLDRLSDFNLPVVRDLPGNYGGPLAGIITAMRWSLKTQPSAPWVASFPADAVAFPATWVEKCLSHALQNKLPAVYARTPRRDHFIYAVWSTDLLPQLEHEFTVGRRSLKNSLRVTGAGGLVFEEEFDNVNTPEQWRALTGGEHTSD